MDMGSLRPAAPDDSVKIGHMLRRFYQERGAAYGIEYDHASCLLTVLQTINEGVCFIGKRSCAGALFAPFPYNRKAIIAEVPFWYVGDKRELAIFDLLAIACREAGATHINSATLPPQNTGKRFYTARGMVLAECHYLGGLDFSLHPKRPRVKGNT